MKQAPISARPFCLRCYRPGAACLCRLARPFRGEPLFVILLHPREARRTVGTARLVKLCLEDTVLIQGTGASLDQDPRLLAILADPSLDPWLLFPGPHALDVERVGKSRTSGEKRLAILLVDGTWPQAQKMIRTSQRLQQLRCLRFTPRRPSQYGFRRQPAVHCLSTVEAVHEVITRITGEVEGPHDALLELFRELVVFQTAQNSAASHATDGVTPSYRLAKKPPE